MDKKVILFDLDDTLIYTFHNSYVKVVYALKRMNKMLPTIDEFKSIYGVVKFPECMSLWIKEEETEQFLSFYEESKHLYKYSSICQLSQLSEFLSNNKLRTGLVTNTPEDRLLPKVEEVFSNKIPFEYKYVNAEKPNPNGIKRALEYFNVKNSEVIFVGDSLIDYKTAISAEVDFLAVTTGVTTIVEFEDHGLEKSHVFSSITNLMKHYTGVQI